MTQNGLTITQQVEYQITSLAADSMVVHFARSEPALDMKMDIHMAIDVEMAGQSNAMSRSRVMEMTTAPVVQP